MKMRKVIQYPKALLLTLLYLSCIALPEGCGKKDNPSATPDPPNPGPSTLQISSFTPAEGAKGSTITITGGGFSTTSAENTVTFNGKPAVVTAATASSLTVLVPKGVDNGKIAVHTGSQTATSGNDFTYLYTVTTLAGNGSPGYQEGTGTIARFRYPFGVAMSAAGNVLVADGENQRIRQITPAAIVSTLAGTGDQGFLDGAAQDAHFNFPTAMVLDAAGNIYVADGENNRIRKITPSGVVSTFAGDSIAGYKDAIGKAARFDSPTGLAIDAAGNLFVTDYENQRIRKIDPSGEVTTIAGSGVPGYKDAAGTAAQFSSPVGIAVDKSGNLYVTDWDYSVIRKITPGGDVSTFAGGLSEGHADGMGKAAEFINPIGVSLDASGNLYIGDWGNHRIRKISPEGAVTTIAGDGDPIFGDGTGIHTHFNNPCGIVVDATGVVYVADQGNHRIRRLE